ncbi:hypothetical protein JG688_00006527 [Phytophthora aleatoria]|uniref:Uncharacterized protein n=1 Tax=Phytophthora aleatoria TaxID=2496075 RepID=A0A8J5M7P1_9STRA|nr:hypothetical protein JG688_00006527 [Phytophthora aleatoria]
MKVFEPHECTHLFGLLIARMLCPQRRRLSSHWSWTSVGALPHGTFDAWMSRNRFDEPTHRLHFSDNNDPQAKTNRTWE